MFDADLLRKLIGQATWLAANDYEWEMIAERTGMTVEEALTKLEAVVITRGKEGSTIHTRDGRLRHPSRGSRGLLGPDRLRRRLPGRAPLRAGE